MKFSFFPGCTLKTRGADLDQYGRAAAEALGFTLEELPEWQCCGAVYPMAKNEAAPRCTSARAISMAYHQGQELVTLCSACYHVLKRVNLDMKNNANLRSKVNLQLPPELNYNGEGTVLHYLEVLRDRIGFDELKKRVVKPLTGRKIGAYYGCLLLRPSSEMHFDDPENPTILEDFIRAIGAEPVIYSMRNECCGGYVTLNDKAQAQRRAQAVVDNAAACGVEELITACPLCMYNLKQNTDGKLPVSYFTELLAEALGLKEEKA